MRSEINRLPQEFLIRLRKILPSRNWDELANTFSGARPTTFRVNTLKNPEESVREKLEHQGFRLEKVHWYPGAFILKNSRLRELQETEIYKQGGIYVQALSSMLPPLVLDPQPGERILDLTAAPGSKTTQIACLMEGEGEIVANDNNQIRFYKLKANVEMQGAKNVTLSLRPGELFGRDFPEQFDRVLLDAPCSAEGRFLAGEPSSYKFWKPAKIKEMARKQKNLLISAFRALKPGGLLVYSTCTFAPEENEEVLDWLAEKAEKREQVFLMEKVQFQFPNHSPGLVRWENRVFHPAVTSACRIIPNSLMEGFFIAKIRKGQNPADR